MKSFNTQFITSIADVAPHEWNALTGRDYPFLRHEFLLALEQSGSVAPDTGWTPQHYTLRDDTGRLIAAAPAYLKDHSYGEYVFDWSWAHAYQQNRLAYYPKLLTAVPFTPSVGPRLRLHPDHDLASLTRRYITDTLTYCQNQNLSSWHLLFPETDQDQHITQTNTLMKRVGVQYHWYNYNYNTFEDYLAEMKARKRNSIRKERAKVAAQGITFEHITGRDLTPTQREHAMKKYGHYLQGDS